ncbi:MAG TPA: hypothetical protein VGU43_06910 [Thermoplasmata archaeon]|nr:hypothetical protein [Thermoplasmata archaeon]
MSGGSPSNVATTLVVVAVIVLILVRRTYYILKGSVANPARLVSYSVVVSILFGLTVSFGIGVLPYFDFAIDGAVLVVAALLAVPYVRREVRFEQRPPSTDWYYRLSPWIPLGYVGLFVGRIGLLLAVLGPSALEFVPVSTMLSPLDLYVLATVDALFALSTGLLVGRNAGVYLALREKLRLTPEPPAAGAPLPSRP